MKSMQQKATQVINNFFIVTSSYLEKVKVTSGNLSYLARQAYCLREYDLQKKVAERLIDLSPSSEAEGRYFYALALLKQGKGGSKHAHEIFQELADLAPVQIRAAATLATGIKLFREAELKRASQVILEANKMSLSNNLCAPIVAIDSLNMISTLRSIEGDHQGSLETMQGMLPLLHMVGHTYPVFMFEYWNNCAFEHLCLGDLNAATYFINKLTRTPYLNLHPEYLETAEEIKEAQARSSRSSSISVPKPFVLSNVLRFPLKRIQFHLELIDKDQRFKILNLELNDSEKSREVFIALFARLDSFSNEEETGIVIKGCQLPDDLEDFRFERNIGRSSIKALMNFLREIKKQERDYLLAQESLEQNEDEASVQKILHWLLPLLQENLK
jgi:tetratricopeptide (TPR) repeat protein